MMNKLFGMLLLCAAQAARAQEPSFEALGQAPVVAGDRVRARERALDEAFRQAIEQAAQTVLDPDALTARASDLKLRIYPKARSYITRYQVLDEGEVAPVGPRAPPQPSGAPPGGAFQVHLTAQVATGRLQRDLLAPVGPSGTPLLRLKSRAVACARAEAKGEVPAGKAAEETTKALRELLAARNVEALPAPADCAEAGVAEAARAGAAQGAVVGVVELSPAGPIRGTDRVSAQAKVRLRLVEADGRVSAEGLGDRYAYDALLERAGEQAAREATLEASLQLQPPLAAKWSSQSLEGAVSVRLSGLTRYADYLAIVHALSALPGVAAVEPRRFVRGQADVLLRTASSASQLAQALKRVPPQGVRVTVRAQGEGAFTIDIASGEVPDRG